MTVISEVIEYDFQSIREKVLFFPDTVKQQIVITFKDVGGRNITIRLSTTASSWFCDRLEASSLLVRNIKDPVDGFGIPHA